MAKGQLGDERKANPLRPIRHCAQLEVLVLRNELPNTEDDRGVVVRLGPLREQLERRQTGGHLQRALILGSLIGPAESRDWLDICPIDDRKFKEVETK